MGRRTLSTFEKQYTEGHISKLLRRNILKIPLESKRKQNTPEMQMLVGLAWDTKMEDSLDEFGILFYRETARLYF